MGKDLPRTLPFPEAMVLNGITLTFTDDTEGSQQWKKTIC